MRCSAERCTSRVYSARRVTSSYLARLDTVGPVSPYSRHSPMLKMFSHRHALVPPLPRVHYRRAFIDYHSSLPEGRRLFLPPFSHSFLPRSLHMVRASFIDPHPGSYSLSPRPPTAYACFCRPHKGLFHISRTSDHDWMSAIGYIL